jgi:hypothetical protein
MPFLSIMDTPQFGKAIDEAEVKFWETIAAHYPEAKSGDIDPEASISLVLAMTEAAKNWIEMNVPAPADVISKTEIMLHTIEYYFYDEGNELDDSYREHIAYNISQNIASGSLTDNSGTMVGYWQIKRK